MRDRGTVAIGAALAVLLAAGCGSYRLVPPLDEAERTELTSLRTQLSGRRVAVGPAPGRNEPNPELTASLDLLGVVATPVPGAADGELTEVDGDRLGHCLQGMELSLLTLGILPYRTPGSADWRCRFVAADGRETIRSFRLDGGFVIGWLGLPLGLLPGWRTNVGFGEGVEQRPVVRERFALFLGRNLTSARE